MTEPGRSGMTAARRAVLRLVERASGSVAGGLGWAAMELRKLSWHCGRLRRLTYLASIIFSFLVVLPAGAQFIPTPTPRPTLTPTPGPVPPTPTPTIVVPTPTAAPVTGCITVPYDGNCPAGLILSCCRSPNDLCSPYHDGCMGVRMCCPAGAPVPTATPGGPAPTPTPWPTPTVAPTPPAACCTGYEVTVPLKATPHSLYIYCGSLKCFATWPGGYTEEIAPWTSRALSIYPTEEGVIIVYRAAYFSVSEQRCLSVPLLPSNVRADAR